MVAASNIEDERWEILLTSPALEDQLRLINRGQEAREAYGNRCSRSIQALVVVVVVFLSVTLVLPHWMHTRPYRQSRKSPDFSALKICSFKVLEIGYSGASA